MVGTQGEAKVQGILAVGMPLRLSEGPGSGNRAGESQDANRGDPAAPSGGQGFAALANWKDGTDTAVRDLLCWKQCKCAKTVDRDDVAFAKNRRAGQKVNFLPGALSPNTGKAASGLSPSTLQQFRAISKRNCIGTY
ncbi:hypothetical protein [Novosphingobium sp. YAF33]|uniref:hypothetical protein n=1 Tax=Novosphingobium sp. YAF33 TaxID=3233082 RepID=UPI003F9D04E7